MCFQLLFGGARIGFVIAVDYFWVRCDTCRPGHDVEQCCGIAARCQATMVVATWCRYMAVVEGIILLMLLSLFTELQIGPMLDAAVLGDALVSGCICMGPWMTSRRRHRQKSHSRMALRIKRT